MAVGKDRKLFSTPTEAGPGPDITEENAAVLSLVGAIVTIATISTGYYIESFANTNHISFLEALKIASKAFIN